MFTLLFIVFLALTSLVFLVGAAFFQSFHLLFGGLVMALASAIFYAVTKGVQKKKDTGAKPPNNSLQRTASPPAELER